MRENLEALLDSATADQWAHGKGWYLMAHEEIRARVAPLLDGPNPLWRACGIVAVLSPNVSWDRNVDIAVDVVTDYANGVEGSYQAYPDSVAKARRILAGEDPGDVAGGTKVVNFLACLYCPDNTYAVCVDGHAMAASLNPLWSSTSLDVKKYFDSTVQWAIMDEYRDVARDYGLLPNQAQAIVWLVKRANDAARATAARAN